jgi:ribosome recycling factor
MPNQVISDMEKRMKKALEDLDADFGTLRTGRATPALLDKVMVDYYGAPTPLKGLATISAPDARQLLVAPFDKTSAGAIANAIAKSDLGVGAVADGGNVRVSVPSLTTERRKEMVKMAGKKAEAHKIAVRNIRRDANDALKKMEKEGEMSKDDLARYEGEVQKITDRYIADVDKSRAAKETDIMVV